MMILHVRECYVLPNCWRVLTTLICLTLSKISLLSGCYLTDDADALLKKFNANSSSPNATYDCLVAATGQWKVYRCDDQHRVVCQSDYNTLPGSPIMISSSSSPSSSSCDRINVVHVVSVRKSWKTDTSSTMYGMMWIHQVIPSRIHWVQFVSHLLVLIFVFDVLFSHVILSNNYRYHHSDHTLDASLHHSLKYSYSTSTTVL